MSYYGKGAETASVSAEDHEDALTYNRYKRKQLERRIAKLERRVDNLSAALGLIDDDVIQLKEETNHATDQ
jgi:prefoldin subunit 5